MAVHKFRGTPSNAVGTFLWYQRMRSGGWCHFSFFYPALWWFYEQMGHGASALVSAARIIMTTERPDTWGFFSSVG